MWTSSSAGLNICLNVILYVFYFNFEEFFFCWLDHSIGWRAASTPCLFVLLALWMFFAPGLRTFLFFYHLLSICSYIFSSHCDYDCGCNHCCVFFSFSSFSRIFIPKKIFQRFFLKIMENFTPTIFAIPCIMTLLPALETTITPWFKIFLRAFSLSRVVLDTYSYLCPSDSAIILSVVVRSDTFSLLWWHQHLLYNR